jgi:hypothetical protein
MYDDDDASDQVDRRLRAVLRPHETDVRRLAVQTLSVRSPTSPNHAVRWAAATAAAVLVVLAVALWKGSTPSPALDISGTGSIIVVTRPDGNRFVFQTSPGSPARGEYVIAFPQSER